MTQKLIDKSAEAGERIGIKINDFLLRVEKGILICLSIFPASYAFLCGIVEGIRK